MIRVGSYLWQGQMVKETQGKEAIEDVRRSRGRSSSLKVVWREKTFSKGWLRVCKVPGNVWRKAPRQFWPASGKYGPGKGSMSLVTLQIAKMLPLNQAGKRPIWQVSSGTIVKIHKNSSAINKKLWVVGFYIHIALTSSKWRQFSQFNTKLLFWQETASDWPAGRPGVHSTIYFYFHFFLARTIESRPQSEVRNHWNWHFARAAT